MALQRVNWAGSLQCNFAHVLGPLSQGMGPLAAGGGKSGGAVARQGSGLAQQIMEPFAMLINRAKTLGALASVAVMMGAGAAHAATPAEKGKALFAAKAAGRDRARDAGAVPAAA